MERQSRILVVDDDEFALRSVAKVLEGDGYHVEAVASGLKALDLLKQDSFDLILTDLKMPGVDEFDVLRQAREVAPEAVVLIFTGYASLESAIEALREGAYDYLVKPCSDDELKLKIQRGVERSRLVGERQRAEEALRTAYDGPEARVRERTEELAEANEALRAEIAERKQAEEELQQSLEQSRRTFEGTVEVLVSAIKMKDAYTAGHQRRVTQLACTIASEMGLPEEQIRGIHMAGLIHDIGKINVPAEILSKPGSLTDLEYGLLRMHVQADYEALKNFDFPWPVAQIVLQHHERMDGSGYPQGLPGVEILPEARILAVSDVVAAMAAHRPYRSALGVDKALEEISQNRGVLYDVEAVDICLKLFTEKGLEFE